MYKRGKHAQPVNHAKRAVVAGGLAGVLAVSSVPLAAIAQADNDKDDSSKKATEASSAGESEAAEADSAEGSSDGKSEIVYVKADATGAVEGQYVVNKFEGTGEAVEDPADYTEVKNLSTTETLEQKSGEVAVKTTEGEPFYYQGNLASSKELPWDISIDYYLNGKQVDPDDVAGQKGVVRIELTIEPKTDAADGLSDFANSFMVQAQGTFDASKFNVTSAKDCMLATSGNNTIVTIMGLPGESKTYSISGTTESFESEGWQIAAMPLSLALSVDDMDTSDLTDGVSELTDATSQLSDGASQINDGAGELVSGLDTLSSGTSSLSSGASSAANGASSLESGAATLSSGVTQVNDGASSVAQGAAGVSSGTASVSSGLSALEQQSGTLVDGINSASAGAQSLASSGSELTAGWQSVYGGITQVQSGAQSLAAGSSQFDAALSMRQIEDYSQVDSAVAAYQAQLALVVAGQADPSTLSAYIQQIVSASANYGGQVGSNQTLSQVQSKYGQISSGISQLSAGADSLASGAASFDSGLSSYTGGVSSLSAGLSSASAGAQQAQSAITQLSNGASQVADGAAQLSSGANSLESGTSQLASGASQLENGAASLSSGLVTLSAGAQQLESGAQSAASGASTLASATSQLASGASELNVSVAGLDQEILDGIQDAINEKLGEGYQLHSYVVPSNTNVSAVQFVYMIDGISTED